MKEKIKLYILTGFLGSGKTTFLTNVLKDLEGKKIGIIQNEFGKIGIDGEIIKKDGMELVELNRGSIFCSCLKISFVEAMNEMADRDIEYLFVESSGLADPSNIGEILEGIEVTKGDLYEYKGAICLVDGVNFLEQLDDIETVERQLKHCHLVIINKTDLIDNDTANRIKEKIKEINNRVKIQTSAFGKIDYNFLDEDLLETGMIGSEDTTNTPENKPKTLNLTFDGTVKKEDLNKFLDNIKKDTYRIKGFFRLEDGWNQVDVVNKLVDFKRVNEEKDTSRLVIISKVGPQIIRPIFNTWNNIIGEEMKLR
ncbi:CobW family GTP-binding protein [Dethiothermospora halolimnae]|uniref:CobW family GTP-binding protein n=1 Tax=Dethiothermospora halolimnae TaxID=3114390 RepID=UPI003CCC4478